MCSKRSEIFAHSKQGVYLGSGIGSLDDVYDTTVAFEKGVSYANGFTRYRLTLCRATAKYLRYSYLGC
jgi:hypothetical protein